MARRSWNFRRSCSLEAELLDESTDCPSMLTRQQLSPSPTTGNQESEFGLELRTPDGSSNLLKKSLGTRRIEAAATLLQKRLGNRLESTRTRPVSPRTGGAGAAEIAERQFCAGCTETLSPWAPPRGHSCR